MDKRLILHIGGSKCGSSAIQDYLALNHAQMIKHGVLTPDVSMGMDGPFKAQQIDFFEDMAARDDASAPIAQKLEALAAHMDEKGLSTLIVSAENLSARGALAPDLARAAASFGSVEVIFYIRRQDDYLISAWQQWGLKTHPDIDSYLNGEGRLLADWLTLLAPWEDSFGQSRITLRPFRRDMLVDGDIVADFLSLFDLSDEGCLPLTKLSNRSFDEHLGDMTHRIRDVFESPHDNRFFDTMVWMFGNSVFKTRSSSHLMSLEDRREFLDRFQVGNEALKQRYLPHMGEAPLFEPPDENDVITLDDIEKLKGENEVLLRMLYTLAKRVEIVERGPPRHSLKYLAKRALGRIPSDKKGRPR